MKYAMLKPKNTDLITEDHYFQCELIGDVKYESQ